MTREWEAAAKDGALDVLRRLHADGADVNARDGHGQTALMLAAHRGHEEAVAWLIEAGAVLDRTAKHGLSAVMLAVICGHVTVVRRLAEAGASLALRGTGESFAGRTALDLAVARNHPEMVEILRSRTSTGATPPS